MLISTAVVSLVTAAVAIFPTADVAIDATAAMSKPSISTEDGGRVGSDYYSKAPQTMVSIPCVQVSKLVWKRATPQTATHGCIATKGGQLVGAKFDGPHMPNNVTVDYSQWYK